MSVTQLQQQILDKQAELVEKQGRLAILIGEVQAVHPEWNPNADEAFILYNDLGQKTVDAVNQLLTDLAAKIGPDA